MRVLVGDDKEVIIAAFTDDFKMKVISRYFSRKLKNKYDKWVLTKTKYFKTGDNEICKPGLKESKDIKLIGYNWELTYGRSTDYTNKISQNKGKSGDSIPFHGAYIIGSIPFFPI